MISLTVRVGAAKDQVSGYIDLTLHRQNRVDARAL